MIGTDLVHIDLTAPNILFGITGASPGSWIGSSAPTATTTT
jgi:hypothetical protein